MAEDLFYQAMLLDLSLSHDRHMAADLADHRHLMGDDHDRDPKTLIDILQKIQDGRRCLWVQRTGRLVAQEDPRIRRQRPCYGDSLLLSSGKLCRIGLFLLLKPYDSKQFFGLPARFFLLNALDQKRKAYIIYHILLHQQIEMLEDHRDILTLLQKLLL